MSWLSFRLHYFAGKDALERNDCLKAQTELDRALESRPAHPDTTLLLAQARWRGGRKEEARGILESLLEQNPGLAAAYFTRGKFLQEEKNFESASCDMEKAAGLDPKNAGFWHESGKMFLMLGQWEKASEAFDKAARLDPFLTPSALAALAEQQGDEHP